MPRLELYPFRYLDPVTGKWRRARHKAELHEIKAQHAPGEWEIVGRPEIREVDPRAGFFTPWPRTYTEAESLANVVAVLAIKRSAQSVRMTIAGVAT